MASLVAFLYRLVRSGVPLGIRFRAYGWQRGGDLAVVATSGDEGSISAALMSAVFDAMNR